MHRLENRYQQLRSIHARNALWLVSDPEPHKSEGYAPAAGRYLPHLIASLKRTPVITDRVTAANQGQCTYPSLRLIVESSSTWRHLPKIRWWRCRLCQCAAVSCVQSARKIDVSISITSRVVLPCSGNPRTRNGGAAVSASLQPSHCARSASLAGTSGSGKNANQREIVGLRTSSQLPLFRPPALARPPPL